MMSSSTTDMLPEETISQRMGASNHAYRLGRHSTSTLSMRNKKHLKRQASAHHNSNFQAGYVPVTEAVLQRTGIRGRKRYFLYCTLGILLFIAILNTLVTTWLLFILGMTYEGANGLEMIKTASSYMPHFFSSVIIPSIVMKAAPIGARYNGNLTINAWDSPLYLKGFNKSVNSPSIVLDNNTMTIQAEELMFKSNNTIISLNTESLASRLEIWNFDAPKMITKKLQSSKLKADIILESSMKDVFINGTLGVEMTSSKDIGIGAREITIDADNSVIIQSKYSVYIDPSMPKVMTSGSSTRATANKLCICGNGRLFLVPIPRGAKPSAACKIGKKMAKKVCR